MKLRIFLFRSLALILGACGKGGAPSTGSLDSQLDKGKGLAKLGGAEIHEGYLELLSRVNPNIEGQIKTPAGKKRLVDSLLEQELLYEESIKQGVDDLPQVQEKAALYTRVIYGQALVDEEINKRSKEYYNQNKDKEFSRVKIAHILVRPKPPAAPAKGAKPPTTPPDKSGNEAEALTKAQEAKAKLASGAKWDEVVVEYSMDVATKSKGGELGYVSRGDRRAARLDWNEMIDKAFTMKVGEVSDPIKAKDGYHIITLQEEASVAPYEEVGNSIKFKLRAQVKNEIQANLTKGAKTEYLDPDLGSAGASPGVPPGLNLMPQGASGASTAVSVPRPAPAAPAGTTEDGKKEGASPSTPAKKSPAKPK